MPEEQAITQASPPAQVALTKNGLMPTSLDEAWRYAQALSRTQFVPATYRGKPDDCLIAIDMAQRLGVAPLMFLQNTYVVHGKPGMEAKLVIALVNNSTLFTDPMEYEVVGDDPAKDNYKVRAFATRASTGKVLYGPWIDWDVVKKEGWYDKPGSKWQTMPGLMFFYRAASWFCNLHCPEVRMGMSTIEELSDMTMPKQVESTVLAPTEGRQPFGFQQPDEQEPAGEAGQQEAPQDATPAEEKLGTCFYCKTRTKGRRRHKGHLACKECIATDRDNQEKGQEGEPTEEPAMEPETAPAPASETQLDPDRIVKCDKGHEFAFSLHIVQDGIPCCPECGAFISEKGADPEPQQSDTLTCKKGHVVARKDVIPSQLAKPPFIGKCPVCHKNGQPELI